ncbi:RidA family protein [Ramlibacter sp. AN1015]|uniref:RidA family protein n=1 Tax=Ramlibacter sp. AN1015 TaxID=3133428 RepID=UPI0030BE6B13
MSLQRLNPQTVAAPLGPYSQGVVAPAAGRWLHVAGQVGIRPDGSLAQGFEAQAEAAWQNLLNVLDAAGMDAGDLVKVTTFVTDAAQVKLLGPVRARFLGESRPASTLLVVPALAHPDWLVEVEAVACRA